MLIRITHKIFQINFFPNLCFKFSTKTTQDKTKQITSNFTELNIEKASPLKIVAGRAWKAQQLRIKSTQDLHKLWFTCVKQKNIILADKLLERRRPQQNKDTRIRRLDKVQLTMRRILFVIQQRQNIRKQYRKLLEEEYIEKKRAQLAQKLKQAPEPFPQITWEMLRAKYQDLRRGVDNVKYLERIWKHKQDIEQKKKRAEQRLAQRDQDQQFTSFWQKQMTIGEKPSQEEILRTHVKNWKSLNIRQRRIILGFLNARRSKDAKAIFVKELKILGQKIAYEEAKERSQS